MEKKEESKTKNKIINILILLIIFIVSVFMYAKYVEPSNLKVKEYRVSSKKIPENFSGTKIIFFTDLLFGSTVSNVEVENLIKKINTLKPDIVLYGGNLLDSSYKINDKEKEELIKNLKKIDASLGKYTTLSNDNKTSEEILEQSDFKILNNIKETIYNESLTPINLIGLSSYNKGEYNIIDSFKFTEEEKDNYLILLTHEPDIIDKVLKQEKTPDLILAGNTLGGEINVPFYGPLYKFSGSKKYYEETYEKGSTKIFISNGLGTKKIHLRLNNTPSITLFRLKSIH